MNSFDVEVRVTAWNTYSISVKARNAEHAMEKVREMTSEKFSDKAEFIDSEDGDFEVMHAKEC